MHYYLNFEHKHDDDSLVVIHDNYSDRMGSVIESLLNKHSYDFSLVNVFYGSCILMDETKVESIKLSSYVSLMENEFNKGVGYLYDTDDEKLSVRSEIDQLKEMLNK